MKSRLALAAAGALVAAVAAITLATPAQAVLGCDDNSHDIEVRYQDKCVLVDVPTLPPITR